jgi:hypothetical protein
MWLAHELSIPTRSRGCLTREADGLLVVLNPVEYVATMSERMACACNSVPDMPMLNALKRHAPSPFTFTKVKPLASPSMQRETMTHTAGYRGNL